VAATAVPSCTYVAPGEATRRDLSDEDVRKIVAAGEGVLWYRLTEDDETSRHVLSDVFGFHPLAIDDCFNGRVDTPKIDDYGSYLFVVAQSVQFTQTDHVLSLNELDVFLGKNYVVTVQAKQEMPLVDKLFEEAQANPHLIARGADFLAHTIIDVMVDQLLPAVEEMDEALDRLEQMILDRPGKRHLTSVLRLKRETLLLRRSILPQRDIVNRLSRGEYPSLIRSEALIFYRDIYDHIVRVESLLEGLRDLADGSLSSYLSAVNNRMNEVMKAMSVVAVIFLPLNLLASLYGTNLDYSPFGLTLGFGFFVLIAFMICVATTMIVYFRRRGWF
jgi:magnesium transporter